MKPLKDIGHRVEPSPHSLTKFEPYTVYHDVERRELVREVVEKYVRANLISSDETEPETKTQVDMYLRWADELIESEGI